jgi:uncharacterized protein with PQ loop repeat
MREIVREVAGFVMVFSFMFCYLPQIIKIYKTKSSEGLSLMLVLMCIVGYASGLVYMFLTSFGIWWFLNYLVGLVMCLVLTHAWFKYHRDDE